MAVSTNPTLIAQLQGRKFGSHDVFESQASSLFDSLVQKIKEFLCLVSEEVQL